MIQSHDAEQHSAMILATEIAAIVTPDVIAR